MTNQNGRAFNEWLRAQLKAKKMSQRQLAQQSGVDHSTISRLIRGDRMPSLGTATKLARGLRELHDDADTPAYLGIVSTPQANPTARVEYALRADELLSEAQVRQVMEYYLAVRMRRFGRTFQPDRPDQARDASQGGGSRGLASSLRPQPPAIRPVPSTPIGMAGRYTALRPLSRPLSRPNGSGHEPGG
ncbi:MAG TPA: helix-turn-helix transcriptional regulator [Candidatus Limnocylindrales bacterium]|nr:helix-turn-helix transcriptional regulator [Candidatus Limnocylindrales bacterium]